MANQPFTPSPETQAYLDRYFAREARENGLNDEAKAGLDRIIGGLPTFQTIEELDPPQVLFAELRPLVMKQCDEDKLWDESFDYDPQRSPEEEARWREERWELECDKYYRAYLQAHGMPAILEDVLDHIVDHFEVVKELLPHTDFGQVDPGVIENASPAMRAYITAYLERQQMEKVLPKAQKRAETQTQDRGMGRGKRL